MRSRLATNRSFSLVTQIRPVRNFLCGLLRPPETSLLRNLGSPGTAAVGACNTQFWGTPNVPYDYQVFGI